MTQMKLTGRFALLGLLAVVAATSIAAEKKGEKKAKKPAEFKATCPVLGELAEKDALMMYRGKKLYFCCQSCPDIFNATPKVYTTAVHLQWFQTGEIAQVACPLKGHDLDDVLSVAVPVGGVKVKVCCPGCAKKLAALKVKMLSDEDAWKITVQEGGAQCVFCLLYALPGALWL